MNKKVWTLLSLLVISAMLLVACGGAEEEVADEPVEEPTEVMAPEATDEPAREPTDEPAEEPAPEPTEEPAPEPTEEPVSEPEIFITIWADDTRAPIMEELAQDFEATYGVGLVVEQVASINDDFPIAAPAGEGPDILIGPHDRLSGWVASGLIAPIDLGEMAAEFTDVALEAFTWDGVLYGMPYAIEAMGLFRNVDLVPDAPATWDELLASGQAAIDAGNATYAMVLEGNGYKIYPILTSFGGYVFGQDEAGNWDPNDLGVDSDGTIAAGDWIAENVATGLVSDNTDTDTAESLFDTGESAFIMTGPWALNRFQEAGVNYAVSGFPSGGYAFSGVQGFMINALSENVPLALAFLTEFVAAEETMLALQETGNRLSTMPAVAAMSTDADLAAFFEDTLKFP